MRATLRPAFADPTAPIANLNMTPLIDVLLVLLVMMILSVPVITHKVPVDLPQGPIDLREQRLSHRLDLDATGALRLDGVSIGKGALLHRLEALSADHPARFRRQRTVRRLRPALTARAGGTDGWRRR